MSSVWSWTGSGPSCWRVLPAAITEEFVSAAGALTPENVRRYITDLPRDMDVIDVELIHRHVAQPHKYLNLSVA